METIKLISGVLAASMLAGCASLSGVQGPGGPKLVGSSQATEYGRYAEIGVEFSSMGDFVALVSPDRWKSPMATGGSLSWLNPGAWSDDPGRTGRILVGQAVVVGGAVAAASAGGGGGGGDGSTSGGTPADPHPTVPGYTPPGG